MALETLGWREWLALPALGVPHVKAKVDTGARSSSMHAVDIEPIQRDSGLWVRFTTHPHQHDQTDAIQCEAPVKDYRRVTDSGGHRTMRYVIETVIQLGQDSHPIEVTLADRSNMLFRMLIGRTAMKGRYVVDPGRSYCVGKKPEFTRK